VETQTREPTRRPEGALRRFEVQADLLLEQVHRNRHTPRQPGTILVEDEKVVNVNDASYPQLLQKPDKGTEDLCANAWGLGHTEANRSPLQAPAVARVPEAAVFALCWRETHGKVAIGQVDQHAEITPLDGLGHRLDVLHLEWPFRLKLIQRPVIRAEAKTTILLRDREDGRFEVPERLALGPANILCAQAFGVVVADSGFGSQDRNQFLGRPPSLPEREAFPGGEARTQGLVPVVCRRRLDGVALVYQPIDLGPGGC
jgi:hypothetical protein